MIRSIYFLEGLSYAQHFALKDFKKERENKSHFWKIVSRCFCKKTVLIFFCKIYIFFMGFMGMPFSIELWMRLMIIISFQKRVGCVVVKNFGNFSFVKCFFCVWGKFQGWFWSSFSFNKLFQFISSIFNLIWLKKLFK